MLDDFKKKVKLIFSDCVRSFTIEGEEESNIILVEKAIYRFSEGKLWPTE